MLDQDWVKIAVELGGMVVVGLSAFFAVKAQVEVLAVKLDTKMDAQKEIAASQARTIERIENQVSQIAGIIANQRVTDDRLSRAEQDIRDLQRGEGHVLPLGRGAYEIGGKS